MKLGTAALCCAISMTALLGAQAAGPALPTVLETDETWTLDDGSMTLVLVSTELPEIGRPHSFTVLASSHIQLEAVRIAVTHVQGVTVLGDTVVDLPFGPTGQATASFRTLPTSAGTWMIRVTGDAWRADGNVAHGLAVGWYVLHKETPGLLLNDLPIPAGALPTVSSGVPPIGWDPSAYIPPVSSATESVPAPLGATGFNDDAELSLGPGVLSHSKFKVSTCWNFRGPADLNQWNNQRWATVRVMDEDSHNGDDELWVGLTDNNGCFTSGDITRAEGIGFGNQDIYIEFRMANSKLEVDNPGLTGVHVYDSKPVQTVGSEDVFNPWGELAPASYHLAAWQFQFGNNAFDWGANWGGRTINWFVQIEVPYTGCNPGCYNAPLDVIRIHEDGAATSDLTPHEYAHFLVDKWYGADPSPPDGAHSYCDPTSSTGLAWGEGFPNFYGGRSGKELGGAGVPGADGDDKYAGFGLETNTCVNRPTGDSSEANVAMTLYDLVDAGNDAGGENADYTNSQVLQVVDDCWDDSFRNYYDGGGCSWLSHGHSSTNFLDAACWNTITTYGTCP